MIRIQKIVVAIQMLCYLSSCVGDSPNAMTDLFKTSAYGLDSLINISTDSIRSPYAMEYQNNTFIFCDIHNENFISLFDNDGNLLGELAPRGAGPNEFIHVGDIFAFENNLCLWDMGKSALSYLKIDYDDIPASVYGETIRIKEREELIATFQERPIDDSCFVVSGIVKGHRFVIVNREGDIVSAFGDYPKGYDARNTDADNGFAYQGSMTFQEKRDVFVSACLMGESISFYDLRDRKNPKLIKEYTFSHPKFDRSGNPKESVAFHRDNNIGFIEVKMSDDYCVCLYSGNLFGDANSYMGDKLLLFDWEGNPQKIIHLKRSYKNMAIDNERRRIILLGTDENGDYILSEVAL